MTRPEYYLSQAFLDFFRQRVADRKTMALVSVLSTEGSTYSKAGTQMLVDEDRLAQGMLSGGCLEGDLADRVTRVLDRGEPVTVTYDLSDEDELFGLNVGCEGTIHALLSPLLPDSAYEPVAGWIAQLEQRRFVDIRMADTRVRLYRPRSLLLLGAGKDAEPLISLARVIGWHVTAFDHRAAYLENPAVQVAESVRCGEPDQLADAVDLGRMDAAVIMSHNLAADAEYLKALAGSDVGFVGLIGPPRRRDRLLSELGEEAGLLAERLSAPVGTMIGGRGPAAIALEIVAELQAYFSAERS